MQTPCMSCQAIVHVSKREGISWSDNSILEKGSWLRWILSLLSRLDRHSMDEPFVGKTFNYELSLFGFQVFRKLSRSLDPNSWKLYALIKRQTWKQSLSKRKWGVFQYPGKPLTCPYIIKQGDRRDWLWVWTGPDGSFLLNRIFNFNNMNREDLLFIKFVADWHNFESEL